MNSLQPIGPDLLVAWLDTTTRTWLPPQAPPSMTLKEALENASAQWPEPAAAMADGADLLFPLAFHSHPSLTAGQFHQLIDACCEASRAGGTVVLAGTGIGRNTASDASDAIDMIASILAADGWKIRSVGDVSHHAELGLPLAARARLTSYTRRLVDLPDLLVAAASDLTGTPRVYIADGVVPGRHLSRTTCVAPLGKLHTPGQPFAPRPPDAKQPPAGVDQMWAAALTLGLCGSVGMPGPAVHAMHHSVRSRLAPAWKRLCAAGLTRHHAATGQEPRRLVLSGPARRQVVVPLFGAPTVSGATQTLVQAAAAFGPIDLVFDDITPRVFYDDYPAEQIRERYQRLAAAHRGKTTFLSDLDPDELSTRLDHMFTTLTVADLISASPVGRAHRRRGALTGYDAVHLAVMGVASGLQRDVTIAAQASNIPALKVLAPHTTNTSFLARTGPAGTVAEHEIRLSADWLTALTAGGHHDHS